MVLIKGSMAPPVAFLAKKEEEEEKKMGGGLWRAGGTVDQWEAKIEAHVCTYFLDTKEESDRRLEDSTTATSVYIGWHTQHQRLSMQRKHVLKGTLLDTQGHNPTYACQQRYRQHGMSSPMVHFNDFWPGTQDPAVPLRILQTLRECRRKTMWFPA